jgi:sarcosine oxidase subunit delta
MFSIHCPYCKEPRDQNEFSPAGEAFIARPENPEALSDEQWADYVFYRTNLRATTGSNGFIPLAVENIFW